METRTYVGNTLKRDSKIVEIDHHSNIQSCVVRTTTHKVDIGRVAAHKLLTSPK
jgi:hypothetical protein